MGYSCGTTADRSSLADSRSKLIVLRLPGEGVRVFRLSATRERSVVDDEKCWVCFAREATAFGGDVEGRSDGLGCSRRLVSDGTFSSPRSSLLTYPQFQLPHMFASSPLGIPPVLSAREPIPRSPLTMTACLLSCVGVGGLINVEGASVFAGVSREASMKAVFGLSASTGMI